MSANTEKKVRRWRHTFQAVHLAFTLVLSLWTLTSLLNAHLERAPLGDATGDFNTTSSNADSQETLDKISESIETISRHLGELERARGNTARPIAESRARRLRQIKASLSAVEHKIDRLR